MAPSCASTRGSSTWSVRHRFITIVLGLLVFASAMAGARLLPSGFLPASDTSRSLLAVELPPGSQLADTEAVTETIANRLRSRPEVESVFVDGGRIPPSVVEVGKAALTINYVPKAKRSLSQQQLEQAISRDLADIPDVRYWFLDDNGQRNVTFIVTGQDSATVANVASELAAQMRRLPMVANVVSGATLNRPELRIYPRRDLAVRLGVSTESLSETIRVATIGDVGPALAKFDAGDRTVPIRVLLEENARADRQVLEQIRVPSQRGGGVPLVALADISFGEGPTSIVRYDRQRQASVEADLVGGAALSDAIEAVKALSVMKNLPPGIKVSEGGDAELQAELFEGFGGAMRNGLMMVYVVLAVLFVSLLQPLTILFSLPLVDRGRDRRASHHELADHHARRHRHSDADGHRHQECDHAGRFRGRGHARRSGPYGGDHRCRSETGTTHRHDDDRDGGRHGPERLGVGRRRRVSLPDGDRGHRRARRLDIAVAAFRAGVFHRHGRSRATSCCACSGASSDKADAEPALRPCQRATPPSLRPPPTLLREGSAADPKLLSAWPCGPSWSR